MVQFNTHQKSMVAATILPSAIRHSFVYFSFFDKDLLAIRLVASLEVPWPTLYLSS